MDKQRSIQCTSNNERVGVNIGRLIITGTKTVLFSVTY